MTRILIVEDDPITARLLAHLLGNYGRCEIADDGQKAVELFEEAHRSGGAYDLILLDIMLPRKSGLEVLKWVRDFEAHQGIAPLNGVAVVMATALGDEDNVLDSYMGGCTGYLVKPVTREGLEKVLEVLGFQKRTD